MTVSVVEGALGILEIMPDSSALAIRDGQAADDIYYSLARTIADLLAMVAPSTVSYTHLTLPTIYSV